MVEQTCLGGGWGVELLHTDYNCEVWTCLTTKALTEISSFLGICLL
uniref:Uncharacterized protein n=1 Tax=Anguilla anguilla TaxID=7936 RepID=A0A0E9WXM4_ANGAN